MAKHGISVTLDKDNWVWLKGRTKLLGARGISELIDQLVSDARARAPLGRVRSVINTIDLDPSDPSLDGADEAVRQVFAASLSRPLVVRKERTADTAPAVTARPPKRTRRA